MNVGCPRRCFIQIGFPLNYSMAMPSRLRGCIRVWTLLATIEKRDKRYLLANLFFVLLELKLALEIELELTAAKY